MTITQVPFNGSNRFEAWLRGQGVVTAIDGSGRTFTHRANELLVNTDSVAAARAEDLLEELTSGGCQVHLDH